MIAIVLAAFFLGGLARAVAPLKLATRKPLSCHLCTGFWSSVLVLLALRFFNEIDLRVVLLLLLPAAGATWILNEGLETLRALGSRPSGTVATVLASGDGSEKGASILE